MSGFRTIIVDKIKKETANLKKWNRLREKRAAIDCETRLSLLQDLLDDGDEANGVATSASGLHIADVIGRFLFKEADIQPMHGIEDITAGLENRQDEKGRYKLVIYDADYKELKHYWVNAL